MHDNEINYSLLKQPLINKGVGRSFVFYLYGPSYGPLGPPRALWAPLGPFGLS